jgi:hypothetical protein
MLKEIGRNLLKRLRIKDKIKICNTETRRSQKMKALTIRIKKKVSRKTAVMLVWTTIWTNKKLKL